MGGGPPSQPQQQPQQQLKQQRPQQEKTMDNLQGHDAAAAATPSPAYYSLLRGGDPSADTPQDDEVHLRSISGFALFSRAERGHAGVHKALTRRRDLFVSYLGSYSTAYNIVNISLAMVSMGEIYPQGESSKSLSASTMFAGMVAGQLGFGFIGDAVGLVRAFRLTMLLQVAGALWGALVFPPGVYTQLAVARFVLGIGAGGVYPLAAAVASNAAAANGERTGQGAGRSSDSTVALVFALQGVAFVSMNLLATIFAYTMEDRPQTIFRLLLGLGTLPGLAILLIEALGKSRALAPPGAEGWSAHDAQSVAAAGARGATRAVLRALRQPKAVRRLVGCSLTWLLYDVCFFGNTLFQPAIGNAIFGGSGSLRTESKTSLLLALVALPGYFVAVLLIDRLGPRYIQVQGFLICALLYVLLACIGDRLIDEGLGGVALLLYGLSFTFFNFGPGATTYLYPSKLFPPEAKASLNGVAAAAGKIGGFLGGYLFPILDDRYGLPVVLSLCAAIAFLGAALTAVTLDDGDGGDCKGREQVDLYESGGVEGLFAPSRQLVDPTVEGGGGKEQDEGEEEDGEWRAMMQQRERLAQAASSSSTTTSLV